MDQIVVRVDKQDLEQFVTQVFLGVGLDEQQSAIIARHLVLANLRGVDSHGVGRVEIYTRRLESGLVNKRFEAKVERESPASVLLDGANGSGIVLATKGIERAVDKAKQAGLAVVGIKNSNHCGMLADYTMYAARQDCIALAFTNAPANMAPWGGRERFFGTNPFSYAVPAGDEPDVVFDMATSVVSRGKIIIAEKNRQRIPLGWAISKEGKPTTDPSEALAGLVLPVGEHKGYGIALLVETLSALFTGAAFGPHIGDLYQDFSRPQNVGQCFLVMRADLFMSLQEFKSRMDQMIRQIREIPLMEGVERIYLPGEIELEKTKEREANGIPLSLEIVDELVRVGKRYGVVSHLAKHVG
ncbi:Ldh family oxidoreductase [Brevibacillus marinus]|uniref:Ldh family oxidoreductase n=1 Tax=Brevibacillus marinus TaxID=2496837 RepID=UPI0013DE8EE2|nr:Ldh family oxidoreductase [Brevibacillus marinus]